jgi:hypothetical protein
MSNNATERAGDEISVFSDNSVAFTADNMKVFADYIRIVLVIIIFPEADCAFKGIEKFI